MPATTHSRLSLWARRRLRSWARRVLSFPGTTRVPPKPSRRLWTGAMTARRRLWHSRLWVIVEPVCGQIKEARGFRRFLLRGLDHIRGEWRLVCVTHNLLKIWRSGWVVHAVEAVRRPVYGFEMAPVRAL